MSRRLYLVCAQALAVMIGSVIAPSSAGAQQRPTYLPTRDVVITYRVTGRAARDMRQLVVRFTAATQRIRVETDDQTIGYLLVDPRARTARMVVPSVGQYVDLPLGRDRRAAMLFSDRLNFTRRGTSRLVGLACNQWDVQGGRDSARACITEDGVILRAEGRGGDVAGSRMEATRVDFMTQPGRLFDVPQGTGGLNVQDFLRPLLRPN